MNELATIDITALDTVSGGENMGPNQTNVQGNLSVNTGPLSVTGQGSYQSSRTDYAQCLDSMRGAGANFQQMSQACGMPPGAQQATPGAGQ